MLKYFQSSTVLVSKPIHLMPYTKYPIHEDTQDLLKHILVTKGPSRLFNAVLHGEKITYNNSADEPEIRSKFEQMGFIFGRRWNTWTIKELPLGYTLGLPKKEAAAHKFTLGEAFLIFNQENSPVGVLYADETGEFPLATMDDFLIAMDPRLQEK